MNSPSSVLLERKRQINTIETSPVKETTANGAGLLRSSFLSLYKDRVSTFKRSANSSSWLRVSKYCQLTDLELLSVISLKSNYSNAVSINDDSHFVVLSIENEYLTSRRSIYKRLTKSLEAIGVSSPVSFIVNEFNHVHIYLCFEDAINAKELFPLLEKWLKDIELDSDIRILYKQQPIELPLQRNFAWVDDSLTPILKRNEISTESAISRFLSDLNKGLLNLDQFLQSISIDLKSTKTNSMSGHLGQEKISATSDLAEACADYTKDEIVVVQTLSRQLSDTTSSHQESLTELNKEEQPQDRELELFTEKQEHSIDYVLFSNSEKQSFQQLSIPFSTKVDLPINLNTSHEGRGPP